MAAPCWAGLFALVNQGRKFQGQAPLNSYSPTEALDALYNLPRIDFHDITSGNNGFPAGPGYDLVTGLGSPVANLLVPDLMGPSVQTFLVNDGSPQRSMVNMVSITFNTTVKLDSGAIELIKLGGGSISLNVSTSLLNDGRTG